MPPPWQQFAASGRNSSSSLPALLFRFSGSHLVGPSPSLQHVPCRHPCPADPLHFQRQRRLGDALLLDNSYFLPVLLDLSASRSRQTVGSDTHCHPGPTLLAWQSTRPDSARPSPQPTSCPTPAETPASAIRNPLPPGNCTAAGELRIPACTAPGRRLSVTPPRKKRGLVDSPFPLSA